MRFPLRLKSITHEFLNSVSFVVKEGGSKELLRKIILRFTDFSSREARFARDWAAKQALPFSQFLEKCGTELQESTDKFTRNGYRQGHERLKFLSDRGIDLGGSGHVALLFLLTLRLRPKAVLETGVAAGHSSYAILQAIKENGSGFLYSSDFPYFRIRNSKSYVGIVVPEDLRNRWQLFVDGDDVNVPKILSLSKDRFQLVHYDSDKRKKSRRKFFDLVRPYMDNQSVLIFDDIQDDLSFREIVTENQIEHLVFEWEGKFLGCMLFGIDRAKLFSSELLLF